MGKKKASTGFNKHYYYEKSVQNPSHEVEFLADEYKRIKKRKAKTLREDFGGTGFLSCTWVAKHKENEAVAIDLDSDPIEYGKLRHYSKLNSEQQKRMKYTKGNVLSTSNPKADIICAFNFSYFIFKKRKEILKYFKAVRKTCGKNTVFFLDLFGGPESQTLLEEETEHDNFSYFWDCQKFNPITNECLFAIHFKDEKGKKHKNCFTYDWRLWSMPELTDLLEEAGFSKVITYWEGDDDDDDGGNGEFYPSREEENCDSWVTYIAALP